MYLSPIQPVVTCVTCLLAATAAIAAPPPSSSAQNSLGHVERSYVQNGMRSIGYYGNWAVYDRKFNISMIPAEHYSHILYSFADVSTETGEVFLNDLHADIGKSYSDDSTSNGNELQGNLQQLYQMKENNRHLKTMLSIGGYTLSPHFVAVLASEAMRANFARTSVDLMSNFGFDGLSIDYENVASPTEASNMVDLLQKIRTEMDSYAKSTNSGPFLFSYAAPAGPINYLKLELSNMDKYLDFWDLMAYDYSGAWDKTANHASNLFFDPKNPTSTPFNTKDAVDYYLTVGNIAPGKINIGLPVYGHAFDGTEGPGTPYRSIGEGYSWEAGIWDYKALPIANCKVVEMPEIGASYCYDANTKYMVTYDTPNIAKQKANWIKENNLGGALFWEVSADKTGDESLVGTVAREFGKLEDSMNHLSYPTSVYALLKNGQAIPIEESTTKYDKWSIDVEITDAEWWLHTRESEEKISNAEEGQNVKESRDGPSAAIVKKNAEHSASGGKFAPTTSQFGVVIAGLGFLLLL
ncbi:glycoside hydrolase family 18 protein [Hyaloscypha hepaticicola]|uniref:chitinase n=1 Tax=Hyaloscypha hepaticicola TaxID=2082293 RepID=A0A2J6Q571_9HELO|nr:glycoside hydrolase family 18 protein [Hyaloscypha hepaticicola]